MPSHEAMPSAVLRSLHVYPVKALRGSSPAHAVVEPWGLSGDRRWALADPAGRAVTQRQRPLLTLAHAQADPDGGLRVSAPGRDALTVAVPDASSAGTVVVEVFGSKVDAVPAGAEADAWFSDYTGADVQLVYMGDPAHDRPVDPDYARPGDTVSFADGYPLLAAATASLDTLNALVAQGDHAHEGPLGMERFRPNLVIGGTRPWEEDRWERIAVGEVVFRVVKPCGRCAVTTVDPRTAAKGKEPLRTLSRHRRTNGKVLFGQNLIPETTGTVRVGDPVRVLATRGGQPAGDPGPAVA